MALWVVVVVIAIILLVVLRQLGLIYVSMDSSGHVHLDEGPKQGSTVAGFDASDELTGEVVHVPTSRASLTLLVFASSHCALCVEAVRGACEVQDEYPVEVVVVTTNDDDPSANEHLRETVRPPARFVVSSAQHAAMAIRSTPQAVVLGTNGRVHEKAIVNSSAHLRELLDHAQVKVAVQPVPVASTHLS